MSSTSDKTTADDIRALARRLGLALTDADLRLAMDLDAHGRRHLVDAVEELSMDVEPALMFGPASTGDR